MTDKKIKRLKNVYHFEAMDVNIADKGCAHSLTNIIIPVRFLGRDKFNQQTEVIIEIPGDLMEYLVTETHKGCIKFENKLMSKINSAQKARKGE